MLVVSRLHALRSEFHEKLTVSVLVTNRLGVPSNADGSSPISRNIAEALGRQIPGISTGDKLPGQTAGSEFERICEEFIRDSWGSIAHLRPGEWKVERLSARNQLALSVFDQYAHLKVLDNFVESQPELKTVLGNDYAVTPDIVVSRLPLSDAEINVSHEVVDKTVASKTPLRQVNSYLPILHATVSCKWTIRSDRAQNARAEALNLIRNRKGNLPHIKIVTAEPMPSRIASLALGTGDIDCVYHFALPELYKAVAESGYEDALNCSES